MTGPDGPKNLCPQCGYFTDAATATSGIDISIKPKPGDVSICLNCGTANIFTASLKLRPMTALDHLGISDADRNLLRRAKSIIDVRGPIQRKETRQ